MIQDVLKGKLLAFAIFALGIATGSVGSYVYETRVRDAEVKAVAVRQVRANNAGKEKEDFYKFVGLTPMQRKEWDAILDWTREEYKKLAAETGPRSIEVRDKGREMMRDLLTEEQKKKLDEWRQRQQQRQQERQQQRGFRGQPPQRSTPK